MLIRIFTPWIVLAAVLGFALGGSFVALGQIPAEQQTQRPNDNQGASDARPSTVSQPHAQSQAAESGSGESTVKSHVLEFFNVKLTDVLIMLFTFVLAWKTSGLFSETAGLRSAADQQAKDMKAAITASEKAAKAATRQAKIAERTLTELERPYLFIFDVGPLEKDADGNYSVPYQVANYGKTPATIEQICVAIVDTGANGEPLDPPLMGDEFELSRNPFIQTNFTYSLKEPLPDYLIGSGYDYRPEDLKREKAGNFQAPEIPVIKGEHGDVFFRAIIRYRGTATGGHETGCLWRYMGGGDFAVRGIGPDHNYQR